MRYLFKTTATMKEYNREKWWIDSGIIREVTVNADNMNDALQQYREIAGNNYGVEISNNALRTKNPMYIDTADGVKQVGFVITGKTDFEDRNAYKWSAQYIELWVTVYILQDAFQEVTA